MTRLVNSAGPGWRRRIGEVTFLVMRTKSVTRILRGDGRSRSFEKGWGDAGIRHSGRRDDDLQAASHGGDQCSSNVSPLSSSISGRAWFSARSPAITASISPGLMCVM